MVRTLAGAWTAAMCALVLAAAARPSASGPVKNVKATPASVTLTGCLRSDGGKYMLTNLKGDQAPTARSWKTGFIRKTTKNVEVFSADKGPKLKDQVGRQVTLTGVKDGDDTHVQAKTVKRIAASCE